MNGYEHGQGKEQKRKAGRPATKDVKNTCKNINVAIPVALLNKWEEVKIVHGSNLTDYITKLIEKDMNANYEHYKDISNILKNESYSFATQSEETTAVGRENSFLTFLKDEIPEIYEQLKANYKKQERA